ncbi:MAG: hypothetical protein A2X83_07985 [Desulfuromonadales bacterium GWD2_54_10]|nr:MAG: hypothetical protein A2X83_07985 [Desulfuromonadales bacterium GWD2_54_10]
MNKGLIIFAREPLPGKVKTRLALDLGDQGAADLYAAMLADVLEQAASLDQVQLLLFWSLETGNMPSYPIPHLQMCEQHGTNLGERMAAAFETAFNSGIESCCIIGSDSPDLPADYIRQAFDFLEQGEADAVFGPAEDGGYYLLGLRRCWQGLFRDIPWSTAEVLEASLKRTDQLGLRSALLPAWYDLDDLNDLLRLLGSPEQSAPRTREVACTLMQDRKASQPLKPHI